MKLLFGSVTVLLALVVGGEAFVKHRIFRHAEFLTWKENVEKFQQESQSSDELKEKVAAYHLTLTENQKDFVTHYRTKCTGWIKKVTSEEEQAELKALYAAKDNEILANKIREHAERLPEEKKQKVQLWTKACAYLWNVDSLPIESSESKVRVRRSAFNHDLLETDWLSESQREEIASLTGDTSRFNERYLSAYNALPSDERKTHTERIVKKCYGWLSDVASQEERDELEQLHHRDHAKCKAKVREYLRRLDNERRDFIERHLDVCENIWYTTHNHDHHDHHGHHHRMRRDHHHGQHTLDDYLKTHLSWLTTEQADELKKLKADGKSAEELQKKVFEYYDAAEGETKTKATELLQGGCRELIKSVIGEEKAGELKQLKESGASTDDIKAKVKEFLEGVTDPHKKEIVGKYKTSCERVFGVSSRKRRDHHEGHTDDDTLEGFVNNHLTWLTAEQKEEILKLKDSPKETLKAKVKEFFDATTGELRVQAVESFKGACREMISKVLGAEKTAEIKQLKESGASFEDIEKKVDQWISEVTDEKKKQIAADHVDECKKIFKSSQAGSRRRRDHHHEGHTLDDYLKTHLSWLTTEQADELKQLKADGKSAEEIQKKVFEFYNAAEGEVKTKATELLQGGCRELIKSVLGEEKASEIKALKESGATNDEVAKKVEEFLSAVTDEKKKELAQKYTPACKRLFGVESTFHKTHIQGGSEHHTGRVRREGDAGSKLEEYFNSHLSWLSDEQKETLRQLKADGQPFGEIEKKVFEFYDNTEGETRTKASELMQGGCRAILKDVLSTEQSAEIKKMKTSGASIKDISAKITEFLKSVDDESKKGIAEKYTAPCKKVFGLVESRKRRGLKPELTHLDFMKAVLVNNGLPEYSHRELSYKILDIYNSQTLGESVRVVVNQCHHLFAEVVALNFYLNDNSARELLHSLRSASSRQLKDVTVVTEICTKTLNEIKETEGRYGSIGDMLVDMFNDLEPETRGRLGHQWKSKCIDWVLEVTDVEERSFLKMLLRTKQFEALRERVNEFISRFDDSTRTQVGHMRPVCEELLGVNSARKTINRIPVETIF